MGQLILIELNPTMNLQRQLNGFVLTVDDITRQMAHESRNRQLLQSLMRRFRASVGSIHSAIEAIIDYPDMSSSQLKTFHGSIHRESTALADILNRVNADYARQIRTHWPLVPVPAADLMGMVAEKARKKLNIRLSGKKEDENHWIKADSYSLLLTFLFLLDQLKATTGQSDITYRLSREHNFMLMDLIWQGERLANDVLKAWKENEIGVGDEVLPMTCGEICGYHEMELFAFIDAATAAPCLRLMFPVVEEQPAGDQEDTLPVLTPGRPVFYDFDLFNQPGQTPDVEKRRLTELSFTVFDTETTGLDPRGGDEIISIGAVRVVNNRLLHGEIFERLVDPKRSISPESTRIHGLDQESVKGRPSIDQVLPWFHRFAEDSVLVAHNAAFDMLLLYLKAPQTGLQFTHPVLDTMLLAEILHPYHSGWQLEDVARRTGINMTGRHTALGDALIAAELLLKLIPLLEKKGICTLREAVDASQKSYLARLKY
jgi:DNA polymerase-3 subunit epsilon